MKFISRQEAAMTVGCYDAAAIKIWRKKGHPLPVNYRPAIKYDGVVYEGRMGELHSMIAVRIQPFGGDMVEGFCFDQ